MTSKQAIETGQRLNTNLQAASFCQSGYKTAASILSVEKFYRVDLEIRAGTNTSLILLEI